MCRDVPPIFPGRLEEIEDSNAPAATENAHFLYTKGLAGSLTPCSSQIFRAIDAAIFAALSN